MSSAFWTFINKLFQVVWKELRHSRQVTLSYVIPTTTAVLCYLNSLEGDFVHDDKFAIVDNPDANGKANFAQLFQNDFWGKAMWDNTSHKSYRPLCIVTFRLDFYLSHGNPWHFHMVNVVLHAAVTFFFVHVLRRVLHVPFAETCLAALYFAVHPIHTEAVTGIVGRADILSGLGLLLTVLFYSRSLHGHENFSSGKQDAAVFRRPWCFWLAMLTGSASMLCKEHGIASLGVCMLLDALIFSRRASQRWLFERNVNTSFMRLLQRLLAVSTTILVLLVFRMWMNGGLLQIPAFHDEDNPASFSDSFLIRLLTFNYLVAFNVWLLLCPRTLSYDWQVGSVPLVTTPSDVRNLATLATYVTLTVAVCRCLQILTQQNHDGEDDDSNNNNNNNNVVKNASSVGSRDLLLVSLILMTLPFLPASNLFFRVGFVVAERVLYVPSLGFCLLVASGAVHLWRQAAGRQTLRTLLAFLSLVFLFLMATKTWTRNYDWQSREALFRSGLLTLPTNAKMHYNYANFLRDIGNQSEAISHYREAIRLYSGQPSYHNNLGTVLSDATEAEACYRETLRLHPTHRGALVNLGNLLLCVRLVVKDQPEWNKGDPEGEKLLNQALLLDPTYVDALLSLSRLELTRDRLHEAEQYVKMALTSNPNKPEAYIYYGAIFQKSEHYEDALRSFQRALALDRGNTEAMTKAAIALTQLGRHSEAENLLKRVVAVKQDVEALTHLGNVYQRLGRTHDAASIFSHLVRKLPDDTRLLLKYVQGLIDEGDFKQADAALTPLIAREPHVHNCHALLAMAKVREGLGNKQEAITFLREASKWTRDDQKTAATIHYELANLYKDFRQFQEALQNYNASVTADPTFTSAHLNLGAVYHLLGKYKKAREHYQVVLKLDPSNQLVVTNLVKLERAEQQKPREGER